ncbi:hypothetical protein DAEQUDRAFT_698972 [Daedalea quercina L-15889]|uniref:HRDC domain-containing protein n=1 Tax=Daedalea quercina L-15889 TaxID=1314783 RepID=A0A165LCS4_9APHY|nr:hypothetical protein DAEQUDRAFT_698972 [Daedalea quercina L-15889]
MLESSASVGGYAAPTTASFNDYNAALQTAALKATKNAAQLPADIPFHRSVDRAFAKDLDAASARVLALANRLLGLVSTTDTNAAAKRKGKARLENEDDVVDSFHAMVVDPMDQLLERADICLDEFLGRSKPPAIAVNPAQPTVQKSRKANVPPGRLDPALQHASSLAKPQLSFRRRPDNGNTSMWQPTLKHKFNAQVPLGYNLRDEDSEEELSGPSALHPYRYEIRHIPYPAHMFASTPPVPPRSFDATPFTWVSTPAAFDAMLDKLRGAQEIAIDLEHHSYRTFAGFVCLMQISTREEDWVVDTLALREELESLNEVFTDPRIVKVLHGAESDIVWLQQDFNLYIVNLFDTYHASKVLDFPRHSLATLLEMYCDFTADKKYQLADWRIRPLPAEMLAYARSDTHFLLYIYDNLRNALLDRGQSQSRSQSRSGTPPSSSQHQDQMPAAHVLVRDVLARSEETALRVYEKEIYDTAEGSGPGGWDTLAKKWNKITLTAGAEAQTGAGSVYAVHRAVYRCVHAWRDRVAREEDESTRYVLPNHYLFVLAEKPPADMAGLLSIFHPVPAVIRRRSKELLDAIRDAVKEALGALKAKTAPEAAQPEASVTEGGAQDGDVQMGVAATADPASSCSGPAQSASSLTGLWAHALGAPKASAAASALLGNPVLAKVEVKGTAMFAAASSALFGDASRVVARPSGMPDSTNKMRFREVVARIHGALVIAPSVPRLTSTGSSAPDADKVVVKEEAEGAADAGPAVADGVELPFVPAAQRGKAETVEDDSIVVVGQRRTRKRKRAPKTAKNEDGPEPVEAFDYGTVSNILDEEAEPEAEDAGAKKRKKKQGALAGYQYGDFPAPPVARAQPRSGNQTRTFR